MGASCSSNCPEELINMDLNESIKVEPPPYEDNEISNEISNEILNLIKNCESASYGTTSFYTSYRELYSHLIFLSNKSQDFKNLNSFIQCLYNSKIIENQCGNILKTARFISSNKILKPWTMIEGSFSYL